MRRHFSYTLGYIGSKFVCSKIEQAGTRGAGITFIQGRYHALIISSPESNPVFAWFLDIVVGPTLVVNKNAFAMKRGM